MTKRAKQRNRGKRREWVVEMQLAMDKLIYGNSYYWCCRHGRKHRVNPAEILIYQKGIASEHLRKIYKPSVGLASIILDEI